MTKTDQATMSRDDLSLTAAFLIALAATLGALFIGEVLGQMPCTMCWYQRIAMFPLVLILGLSLWRGDGIARSYGLPLALAGLAIAAWHSGLYAGLLPEPSLDQGIKLIREAAAQGADYVLTPEVSNMMQLNRKALFEHLAAEEDDKRVSLDIRDQTGRS